MLRERLAGLNQTLRQERLAATLKAKKRGLAAYASNAGAAARMKAMLRGAQLTYGGGGGGGEKARPSTAGARETLCFCFCFVSKFHFGLFLFPPPSKCLPSIMNYFSIKFRPLYQLVSSSHRTRVCDSRAKRSSPSSFSDSVIIHHPSPITGRLSSHRAALP